jgi:hypothetical protein
MKSIDNLTIYSTESYDVDVERKNSNEFIDSNGSSSSSSVDIFVKQNSNKLAESDKNKIQIDSSIEPKYAKTVSKFQPVISDLTIYFMLNEKNN